MPRGELRRAEVRVGNMRAAEKERRTSSAIAFDDEHARGHQGVLWYVY